MTNSEWKMVIVIDGVLVTIVDFSPNLLLKSKMKMIIKL